MIMYRMALFFACVGVMSGVLGYIMEDVGGDNWFDQSVTDMQLFSADNDNDIVESLQFDGGGNVIEEMGTLVKMANMLWSVLGGVFNITGMLDDILVYDVNGVNLFEDVLDFFQIIIYIIYIIGSIQFISNRSLKVME